MENKFNIILLYIFIGLLYININSCCKKLTTLNLLPANYAEITLQLDEGETISFWTDMDLEYETPPLLVYSFKFYEGEKFLFEGGIDPLLSFPKKNYHEEQIGTSTKVKFKGKLEGDFKAKRKGNYTIKINLLKNNTPEFKLHRAKLTFIKE